MAHRHRRGAGSHCHDCDGRRATDVEPHASVRSVRLVLLALAGDLRRAHRCLRPSAVRQLDAAALCARPSLFHARPVAVVPHLVPVGQCEFHSPPLPGPHRPSLPFRPRNAEGGRGRRACSPRQGRDGPHKPAAAQQPQGGLRALSDRQCRAQHRRVGLA